MSIQEGMSVEPGMLVDDVMNGRPATIHTFLAWGLHCVGCPARRLHTVAEACDLHGVPLREVLADLRRNPGVQRGGAAEIGEGAAGGAG